MAALYLHNAIWTPDHSRNSSLAGENTQPARLVSLSNSTLRTVTPDQSSHPTEPLLRSTTSESLAYLDLLSRQPTHPDGPQAGWDLGLNFEGDQTTMQERKGYLEQTVKRRIRRLRLAKAILEFVMGGWAIYNLIRYFWAYVHYTSPTGQAVSLALGTATTLSLAFLMAAALLSFFRPYLLMHEVPLQYLLVIRSSLLYMSSFFLVAPAVVSFALVFAWKNSSDIQLRPSNRCFMDIDVVWSMSPFPCIQPPSWDTLLMLSIVRIILTVLNILFYHLLSREYHHTRRPPQRRKSFPTFPPPAFPPTALQRRGSHLSSPTRPLLGSTTSIPISTHSYPYRPHSLPAIYRPGSMTTDLRSILSSHSQTSTHPDSSATGTRRTVDSPKLSEKDLTTSDDIYAGFDPAELQGVGAADQEPPGGELTGFADRFRSIVSQIKRDTDEAVTLDPEVGTSSSLSGVPEDTPYNPYLGYGLPPLTERRIPILGGFVHQMPTIDSLGSHEASPAPSSNYHGSVPSPSANSCPSTDAGSRRANTQSSSSRSNSLYTNVSHHLVSVNERENAPMPELSDLMRGHKGSDENGSAESADSVGPHASTSSPAENHPPPDIPDSQP